MPPCLTLSIIRYRSRVKWRNPGNGVVPSPTPWCSSYQKGSLRLTLNYGRQLTFGSKIWTSPGGNTLKDTNYTATCLPSWKLYKLYEPDMQDTAGEARTNSSGMYSYGPPHMAKQKQDDQLEHTYSSYVRIQDVALKTCQKRWMIGRSGERRSGISMLAAWHDDDITKTIPLPSQLGL